MCTGPLARDFRSEPLLARLRVITFPIVAFFSDFEPSGRVHDKCRDGKRRFSDAINRPVEKHTLKGARGVRWSFPMIFYQYFAAQDLTRGLKSPGPDRGNVVL